jgi:hypothetical protein
MAFLYFCNRVLGKCLASAVFLSISVWSVVPIQSHAATLFATYTDSVQRTDYLISIDTETGATTTVGDIGQDSVTGLVYARGRGVLFGFDSSRERQLLEINTQTGVATPIGPRDMGFSDGYRSHSVFGSLAYDSSRDLLYSVNIELGHLMTIDPDTGLGSESLPWYVTPGGYGLTYDPLSDTVFSTGATVYSLFSIDPETREDFASVPLSYSDDPDWRLQVHGLSFDSATNTLYAVSHGDLFTIDRTTGEMERIATFEIGDNRVHSIAVAPVPIPAAAWLFSGALSMLGFIRRQRSAQNGAGSIFVSWQAVQWVCRLPALSMLFRRVRPAYRW